MKTSLEDQFSYLNHILCFGPSKYIDNEVNTSYTNNFVDVTPSRMYTRRTHIQYIKERQAKYIKQRLTPEPVFDLGKMIEQKRLARSLTQQELANLVGIPLLSIVHAEQNKCVPRGDVRGRLEETLGTCLYPDIL